MRTQRKRVQKKTGVPREAIGELLLALNTKIPPQRESAIRAIRRVIPDPATLARIILKLQRLVNDTPKFVDVRDHLDTPAARHLFQLNEELAKYRTFPYISTDGKGGWRFRWEVQADTFGDDDSFVLISRAENELPLVLTAIGLASEGLIDRVRRCPINRKWFYARTSESRFCCTKCRERFHERDPARKAKRAEYMRKLYRLHKTKNVK